MTCSSTPAASGPGTGLTAGAPVTGCEDPTGTTVGVIDTALIVVGATATLAPGAAVWAMAADPVAGGVLALIGFAWPGSAAPNGRCATGAGVVAAGLLVAGFVVAEVGFAAGIP